MISGGIHKVLTLPSNCIRSEQLENMAYCYIFENTILKRLEKREEEESSSGISCKMRHAGLHTAQGLAEELLLASDSHSCY